MPTMTVVAENNPDLVGPVVGRPDIHLHSLDRGQNPDNTLLAVIVHGEGSDKVRVQSYQARENAGVIERVDAGPSNSGKIHGSPGAVLTKDWLVTATHGQGSGRLFLIKWRMHATGAERAGDSGTQFGPPGGTADMAYVGGTKAVAALKDANGNLRVIVFNARATNDDIDRHDGDAAGHIENNPSIALAGPISAGGNNGLPTPASPGVNFVVTPCQTGDNRLKVICWRVDGDNIARRGDTGNNGPSMTGRPAVAGWLSENIVVVAYTREFGNDKILALRSYRISGDGQIDQMDGAELAPGNSFVGISNSPGIAFGLGDAGGREVATAVRTAGGALRVDRWTVSPQGNLAHSGGGTHAAPGRAITGSPSICPAVIGSDAGIPRGYYVAARLQGSNRLTITKWRPDD